VVEGRKRHLCLRMREPVMQFLQKGETVCAFQRMSARVRLWKVFSSTSAMPRASFAALELWRAGAVPGKVIVLMSGAESPRHVFIILSMSMSRV
jgi:hypothetical protein